MRPSHVLFGFAGVLVAGAVLAVLLAPEGANVATAVVVPGATALLAVLCAQAARGRHGDRLRAPGRWAGTVLAILFAGLAAWRGVKAGEAADLWRTETVKYEEAKKRGDAVEPTREAHLKKAGASDHDKTYLRNLLYGLSAAGFAAFAALLVSGRRGTGS